MSDVQSLYLVKVEAGANNNKYYRMIPVGDSFEVQYGRIGNTNYQSKTYPMSKWYSTLNSKIKKGYVDQTRLVAEPIATKKTKEYLDIENINISRIVERLQSMARQAIKDNYTISSSNVTETMIKEAQLHLNNLIEISEHKNKLDEFNDLLMELFKTIPRKMSKVRDCLANNYDDIGRIIEREQDLLDVMKGQVVQNISNSNNEEQDTVLNNQTILESMGLQFQEVNDDDIKVIKNSLGNISNKFHKAWKVVNIRTQKRFDEFIKDHKIEKNKLLWHGSRNENWWSIIGGGLVLRPNAVITGKLYGLGIYFAPKSEKSLGYTSLSGSYWANGNSSSAFMGLYDIAYGTPYDVYDFDSKYYDLNYENLQKFKSGATCLHAHAGASLGGSRLRNDEIIIYKEDQCTIKYLVELK